MAPLDWDRLKDVIEMFPKPAAFRPAYGTAGFRADGSLLHSTLLRCGLLMALRAQKTQGTTGIVVTASHNPVADNGVKLVEPTGYMLAKSWEAHADQLMNAEGSEAVSSVLREICNKENIPDGIGRVMIGYDTRPSSQALVEAARQGILAAGGSADIRGLLTTPQLHWMVQRRNHGLPTYEEAYFQTLGEAFCRLVERTDPLEGALIVDCANGVGAQKLQIMQQQLHSLQLDLRNTGAGVLNEGCGADFVQKGTAGRRMPNNFEGVLPGTRCCSIDGDADRLVYFSHIDGCFTLLDGDRIATLAALLVRDLLSLLETNPPITVGVVQTAYANGSSTCFMREQLGLTVLLAKTGVKHLHQLAETFDIGIYFEANGHGTILFSQPLLNQLQQEAGCSAAAAELLELASMVNQAVGDAISGILLVEAALRRRKWTLREWAGMYQDLPSCMLKVKVPDRSVFTTTEAETRALTPLGLQPQIDALLRPVPQGRAFVRPSGTEDVVRIYAEAQTQDLADDLARKVAGFAEEEATKALKSCSFVARK